MLGYDPAMGWLFSEEIWFRTTLPGKSSRGGVRAVHWKGYGTTVVFLAAFLFGGSFARKYHPQDDGRLVEVIVPILIGYAYVVARHHEIVDLRERPKSPHKVFPGEHHG